MSAPLLSIDDLTVEFGRGRRRIAAVRGLSFAMGRERLGVVGESGSGKSTVARAILRLTPGRVTARRLAFDGLDLLALPSSGLRRLRGARIGFVPQDPGYALNPELPVGAQIAEMLRVHRGATRREARAQTLAVLDAVGFREPARVYASYPHQLSGGMGQRAVIAMMTVAEPDLLIADEPTSALDAVVRLKVLALIADVIERRRMGLLLISHDLALIAAFCDRVLVMYGGRIVEALDAHDLEQARHPYTRGLLAARPRIEAPRELLPVLERDPAWLQDRGVAP
jgi:peptide/nickel transport system ATP-binding protein